MNQYPFLAYISLFSSVLPIGVGISKIKILNQGVKILFYYLLVAFVADIYFTWFARGYQVTLGLMHVYYLVENIFIISIISLWQESHRMKRFFQSIVIIYILFWIVAKLTFEPLNGLYTTIASVSQVLLALSAGYTLFVVMGNREQPLINNYRFWILLSFIIYYTGTLFIIAMRGILIHYSKEPLLLVTSIDWCLKIIFNVMFTIGFFCPQTRS
jgi:hypothetical protein